MMKTIGNRAEGSPLTCQKNYTCKTVKKTQLEIIFIQGLFLTLFLFYCIIVYDSTFRQDSHQSLNLYHSDSKAILSFTTKSNSNMTNFDIPQP